MLLGIRGAAAVRAGRRLGGSARAPRAASARAPAGARGRQTPHRRGLCSAPPHVKPEAVPPPPPPTGAPARSNALPLAVLALGAFGLYYTGFDPRTLVGGSDGAGAGTGAGAGAGAGAGQATDATGKPMDVAAVKQEVGELSRRLEGEVKAEVAAEARKEEAAAKVAKAAETMEVKLDRVIEESKKAQAAAKQAQAAEDAAVERQLAVDYGAMRKAIADLLDCDEHDDGSYGPLLVRLAWHNAGTYDKTSKTGGSEGAMMRFGDGAEANWGANAGLGKARAVLEPIKAAFPDATYSDIYSLAGTVAIEEMGGVDMTATWRAGRLDKPKDAGFLPDGRLPDADGRDHADANAADHLRDIFGRMGFSDKEVVCLSGAHALGRCHPEASGYWGPWTRAPTTMSNEYFRLLVDGFWQKKRTHNGDEWTGPEQFEDMLGELMMLPTDLALVKDEKMKAFVELYAKDEDAFLKDFAKAWMKLQELGVKKFAHKGRWWLFGY